MNVKKEAARKARVFLLLLAAFIFAFATGAEAERQRFGDFEIYVPEDWTVQSAGVQTTFMAPGNVAALSIIIDTATGTSVEEVARVHSEAHYGTTPEEVGEGTFVFTFQNENGIETSVIVVGLGDSDDYMIWVTAGEHPQLGYLIESFEFVE